MQGQDNKAWTLDQHTQLLSSEGHPPRGQNLVSHVALKVKPDSIYIYIYKTWHLQEKMWGS
jgi:hypothetical protein